MSTNQIIFVLFVFFVGMLIGGLLEISNHDEENRGSHAGITGLVGIAIIAIVTVTRYLS